MGGRGRGPGYRGRSERSRVHDCSCEVVGRTWRSDASTGCLPSAPEDDDDRGGGLEPLRGSSDIKWLFQLVARFTKRTRDRETYTHVYVTDRYTVLYIYIYIYNTYIFIYIYKRARARASLGDKMPLFGKKDTNKKIKKDGKDDRSPSVEDKYIMKDLLGT